MTTRKTGKPKGDGRTARPAVEPPPATAASAGGRRLPRAAVLTAALVPWALVAWMAARSSPVPAALVRPEAAAPRPAEWRPGRSGPWGVLERSEIRIEPPALDVTVEECAAHPDTWVFPAQSREQVLALLDSAALDHPARESLRARLRCHLTPGRGCEIDPPVDTLIEMSPEARGTIYGELAHHPQNQWYQYGFRRRSEDEATWFAGAGLSAHSESIVRRLMWNHAGIAVFSDPAAACVQISAPPERARALRALARTPALLVRLRVEPTTDIEALTDYWGTGAQRKHVGTLLESMRAIPGGATLDVVHLLPPLVRQRLYTYASPKDPERDCHWTSANYHAPEATDRYLDSRHVREFLATDVREVSFGERRLGDILVYWLDDRSVIHSCIYVADDIVFTKNGKSFLAPWILMALDDVAALYAPDDHFRVRVYRHN